MLIKIDVTDWANEVEKSGKLIRTITDTFDNMQESKSKPTEMSRHLIVNRELGLAEQAVLPVNKLLMMTGGAVAISQAVARQRKRVTIAGKDTDVRAYTATVTRGNGDDVAQDDGPTLVEASDPLATQRAIHYLIRVVIGHIDERLRIIAAGKGDVGAVVEDLIVEIRKTAERYK